VLPIIITLTRQVVEDLWAEVGDQLRSLGSSRSRAIPTLLWDGRYRLITAVLAGFGRAIAEVGAVMIVGGNIEGVTRVMTTAIALETSKGDLPLALALGTVLLAVVGVLNLLIAGVHARASAALASHADAAAPSLPPAAGSSLAARAAPASPATTPGAPLVRLHAASVRFGAVPALRDANLTLHRGERLALLGANGSGKTTLLRLLHGLLPPSGGRAERLPLQHEARAPVAAMLFQRPFLLNLSAQRNVRLALALRGVPRGERARRSQVALQRVGLDAVAARPARSLSGGQQQRLALARAWALQPDILYLDEPTASLDPGAKREIEALIEDVAAAGVTLVMSTHNLGQAKRLASRIVYLEGGRLVVDLPADQFFSVALPAEAALFVKGELPWR
jgi:tungstate transport system ATP-binding protein